MNGDRPSIDNVHYTCTLHVYILGSGRASRRRDNHILLHSWHMKPDLSSLIEANRQVSRFKNKAERYNEHIEVVICVMSHMTRESRVIYVT